MDGIEDERLRRSDRIEDERLKRLDGIEGPLSRPLSKSHRGRQKTGAHYLPPRGERRG